MLHLEKLFQNSISLEQGSRGDFSPLATRFGGRPAVPADFVWPTFTGVSKRTDNRVATRSLAFLFQVDLGQVTDAMDPEGLLPHQGLLSFFYDLEAEPWGYELGEEGAYRAYWFPHPEELKPAEYPADLRKEDRFPEISFTMKPSRTLPCFDDYALGNESDWKLADVFEAERAKLIDPNPDHSFRMLGWPDPVQGNSTRNIEMLSRGLEPYVYGKYTPEQRQEVNEAAKTRWALLLQLDWLRDGDFEFMIGDCGRLYFFLTKEDLAARRFDRVRIQMQCY